MFTISDEIQRAVRDRLASRSTGNAELDAAVDEFISIGARVLRLQRQRIREEEARQLRLFDFGDLEVRDGDQMFVGVETAGEKTPEV